MSSQVEQFIDIKPNDNPQQFRSICFGEGAAGKLEEQSLRRYSEKKKIPGARKAIEVNCVGSDFLMVPRSAHVDAWIGHHKTAV